jgi:hypothetical protein
MRAPIQPIQQALARAALRWRVPYTVLAAVAHHESDYNPVAVGKQTKMGWKAKGLMQLSPDTIARYKVTDPFDPSQSAMAAAEMISHLAKGSNWNWPRVFACYCWGVGNVVKADAEHKPWPTQVMGYIDSVQGDRRWLQAQAEPAGNTAAERLNNAIVGLAALNPADAGIKSLNDTWQRWWTGERRLIADSAVLQQPVLIVAWRKYGELYDRAPLTDAKTPPPAAIEPQLWAEIASNVERLSSDVASSAANVLDWAKSSMLPAGLVVAGVVLWYLSSRRGSDRGSGVGSLEE